MMRFFLYIAFITLLIQGCSNDPLPSKEGSSNYKGDPFSDHLTNLKLEKSEIKFSDVKVISDVQFGSVQISALDYLTHIGKTPAAEDRESLENESVFMLEIGIKDETKQVLESENLTMTEEEAVQYLIGRVTEDYTVSQKGKTFSPEGVQYDGKVGSGNKLRLTFFFVGIDLESEYTIEYYDRLFGKGLIKMKNRNNELISLI